MRTLAALLALLALAAPLAPAQAASGLPMAPTRIAALPFTDTHTLSATDAARLHPDSPCTAEDAPLNAVWYTYRAPGTGPVRLTVDSPDVVLGLFTGPIEDPRSLRCDREHRSLAFKALAGEVYYLAAMSDFVDVPYTLSVEAAGTPTPYDLRQEARPLSLGVREFAATGATRQPAEAESCGGWDGQQQTLWFRTAPATLGPLTVAAAFRPDDANHGPFATRVGVFEAGSDLALACGSDAATWVGLPGHTYNVQVGTPTIEDGRVRVTFSHGGTPTPPPVPRGTIAVGPAAVPFGCVCPALP